MSKYIPLCHTKNNHYVPQFYLKSFRNEQGNIYYLDKNTGICYETTNLKEIAFKKNLYTVKDKITETDIKVFEKLFQLDLRLPLEKYYLSYLVAFLNDEFTKLFTLKYEKDKKIEQKINNLIKESINSPDISRNQELLFGFYEQKFQPIYNQIINNENLSCIQSDKKVSIFSLVFRNIVFIMQTMQQKLIQVIKGYPSTEIFPQTELKNPFCSNKYLDCICYLLTQYFRTNKILSSPLLKDFENTFKIKTGQKVRMDNIMFLLIHFHTLNIIDKLINERYELSLIQNVTDIPFITSDNPAINPYSDITPQKTIPEGCEFFLPLSPKLGILYSKFCLYERQNSVIIFQKTKDINYWNELLFKEAAQFIYGNSREELNSLACRSL